MEGIKSPPQTEPAGSFFTPLIIAIVGIVATSLVILAYHFFVTWYFNRRQPISGRQLAAGVEAKILTTIPILLYSKKKTQLFRVDQNECVVCLGELEDGEMVRLLPNCMHAFHVHCIDKWFLAHTSCPVCRSPVSAPSSIVLPLINNARAENGLDESSSRVRSGGLTHRCASLVSPLEGRRRRLVRGLKRSLSMDQSVIINIVQGETDQRASSSPPPSSSMKASLLRSRSYISESGRQSDQMTSRLMRSLSRLRTGQRGTTNGILPY